VLLALHAPSVQACQLLRAASRPPQTYRRCFHCLAPSLSLACYVTDRGPTSSGAPPTPHPAPFTAATVQLHFYPSCPSCPRPLVHASACVCTCCGERLLVFTTTFCFSRLMSYDSTPAAAIAAANQRQQQQQQCCCVMQHLQLPPPFASQG
jgi:hypothetical protein